LFIGGFGVPVEGAFLGVVAVVIGGTGDTGAAFNCFSLIRLMESDQNQVMERSDDIYDDKDEPNRTQQQTQQNEKPCVPSDAYISRWYGHEVLICGVIEGKT
ncbi:unnamed protein product, partial [Oppiella nova]